jgi:nucleoside triphosphate diphosphatase
MPPALDRLLAIMARLRDPADGCPWDREQDFATIAPYTIEEAYEVADAISRGDMPALKDELGDLLFQVVFHARMAEEVGLFDFADVVAAIADKMVRRHPHVFGDAKVDSAAAQSAAWEEHKAGERIGQAVAAGTQASVLDGVALALPALLRAAKIQARAARIGFDWPAAAPVIAKLGEEIAELEAELRERTIGAVNYTRIDDEMGDILFAAANLARKLGIDPEAALRRATAKFERRFRCVEALAAERGIGANLDALEALWLQVKDAEMRDEPISYASGTPVPPSSPTDSTPMERNREVIRIEPVLDRLPSGFHALRNAARAEGYRMLDTLAAGWEDREIRFAQDGEALFSAHCGDRLVAIGGMTWDPTVPGALRMRRFYVAKEFRRRGIGRRLVVSLLDGREVAARPIVVNAGHDSEAFWVSLGFIADRRQGHTHVVSANSTLGDRSTSS